MLKVTTIPALPNMQSRPKSEKTHSCGTSSMIHSITHIYRLTSVMMMQAGEKEVVMYFTYKQKKYCVNCDWLQYSVSLFQTDPQLRCPDGYRVEICQGTNIFQKRALVFDLHGRKTLTLLWQPYSAVLSPYLMTVQVANEGLYSGQINNSLVLLRSIVDCVFNGIGRFDLCCDFEATKQQLNIIKHLNSGKIYVERKKEGSTFWHETTQHGYKHKQLHCLSWGSKTSEIKTKLYHKSREIGLLDGNECEKPWISNEWEKNGMDTKNVWRLEFSCNSGGQMRYNERQLNLEDIGNPYWIACCFFDMYHKRFVTRMNEGKQKGHKNLDTQVELLLLPNEGEVLHWAETLQHETESQPAVKLLRSLMANLDNEVLATDRETYQAYAKTILEVVNQHNLSDYFQRYFLVDAYTYLRTRLNNVGSGINHKIMSPKQLMN